jgi:hypothetical protein
MNPSPNNSVAGEVAPKKQAFAIDGDTTRTLRDWGFAAGVGEGCAMTRLRNWAEKHGQAAAVRADGSVLTLLCLGKRIYQRTIPAEQVRLVSVRDFILINHPELVSVI